MAEVSGGRVRGRPSLPREGGGLGQQGDDCGGSGDNARLADRIGRSGETLCIRN